MKRQGTGEKVSLFKTVLGAYNDTHRRTKEMTVSQRAHNIRQVNPRISWGEAMSQAYDEIVREQVLEQENRQAMEDIEGLVEYTQDHSGSHFITVLNELMEDIINANTDKALDAVEDDIKAGRIKAGYAYIRAKHALEKAGIDTIKALVYRYEKAAAWDALWRNEAGRVSPDWLNSAENVIDGMKLDRAILDHYSEVVGYFK